MFNVISNTNTKLFDVSTSGINFNVPITYAGSSSLSNSFVLKSEISGLTSSSSTVLSNYADDYDARDGGVKQYQLYQTNGMPKIRTLADSQYYVSLDGSTNSFNILVPTLSGSSYTLEGWFKLNSLGGDKTLFQLVDSTGSYSEINFNGGGYLCLQSNQSRQVLSAQPPTQQWFHLALCVNSSSGSCQVFLNGVALAYNNTSNTALVLPANSYAKCGLADYGLYLGGGYHGGLIDAPTLLNGSLSNIKLSNSIQYTTSFTSTYPYYIYDSNVVMLLLSDAGHVLYNALDKTTYISNNGNPFNTGLMPAVANYYLTKPSNQKINHISSNDIVVYSDASFNGKFSIASLPEYSDAISAFFTGKLTKGSLFRTGSAIQTLYGIPAYTYDVSSSYMNLQRSISYPSSFCIEAWLYPTNNTNGNIDCVVDLRNAGSGSGGGPIAGINCRDGRYNPQWASGSSGAWFYSSTQLVLNTWQHVAWQLLNGNQIQIFVNGIKCLDQQVSGFTGWTSQNVLITALADNPSNQSWKFKGNLSSVKISSGTPYNGSFTPSWDLSDISNALFYLGGNATDSVSNQVLTQPSGTCAVSTRFV